MEKYTQGPDLDTEKLPPANIVVAGITGSGKSTLLNAIFGETVARTGTGRPVTEKMEEYVCPGVPIHIWDTVGLEIDAEKTKKSIENIRKTIAGKSGLEDPFDRIHAIWYCINSGSNRYQGAELEFIKNLHAVGVPFIIILTQCYDEPEEIDTFEKKIRDYNSSNGMNDIEVVQVIAVEKKLRGIVIDAFGLDALVDITMQKLPDFVKGGFAAAQRVSLIQKRAECEKLIYQCVQSAKEGFWDKVPIAKAFTANDRIVNMGKKIAGMYNTVLPENKIAEALSKMSLNFENAFWGLISPIDMGYHKKIEALLALKKQEGFEVNVGGLPKSDRVACMVAFYGYTFMEAVETLWGKLSEEQLKDIDIVCGSLKEIINRILQERWDKIKARDENK